MHRLTRILIGVTLLATSAETTGGKAQVSRDRAAVSATAVHPLFDLTGPEIGPFPSDRFTVPDDRNLTRRRVNLPLPIDCAANKSECEDAEVLNHLDGFSLRPRLTLPFDGDINPATVRGNVFFVSLGDTTGNWADNAPDSMPSDTLDHENLRKRSGFGRITGINQIVWDPTTRVLAAKADHLLEEHTRYALVVTNGILDSAGKPLAPANTFRDYRNKLTRPQDRWYRKVLLAAEWAGRHSAQQGDVIAVSSFTTQSVTYLQEKITKQLVAAPRPAAPDFNILSARMRAIFAFDRIQSITHNQQVSPTGPAIPDEPFDLTGTRLVPGAVGRIAYGKFAAPDYRVHPGEYIPPVPSRTGTPQPQGSNTLYFTLILPSGPKPPGGWPVVVFGHGGNGTSATTPLFIASIPASHGLALISINLVGHGRGQRSTLTLKMTDGSSTTVPAPGRGFDQNRDGMIGTAEGHYATAPRLLGQYADGVTQISADNVSLVRLIQRGVDADGDGQVDLDPSHIYFLGQSLGAASNVPFVAYTQAVRASFFIVPLGTPIEERRMSTTFRAVIGSLLAARIPSLLNSANGLRSIGGVRVDTPFFNENMPFRDVTPLVNDVAGAMAIQRLLDRIEWRGQTGDAAVFARKLRKSPPAGVTARPTVIFIGRGDQSAPLADSASLVGEGELGDRTVLYRHDLFFAANPTSIKNSHTVYRFQGATAPTNPITTAIQEQFSLFFASDGETFKQTSPYLETPMRSPLPNTLDFIP